MQSNAALKLPENRTVSPPVLVAAGDIGHVRAPNPWNVSTALSPRHTIQSLLATVQDVDLGETEMQQPVQLLETQAGRSASRGDGEIRAGQMAWKELIAW